MFKIMILFLILGITSPALAMDDEREQRSKRGMSTFRFWFSTGKPSKMKHHMKVFDSHAIFDFDKEIANVLSNTKKLQDDFRQDRNLLKVQIKHLEKQLSDYLYEHKNGVDRSRDILDTYTKLFELCNQSYSISYKHVQQLNNLLQETHEQYLEKTQKKIDEFQKKPDQLISELIERHDMTY